MYNYFNRIFGPKENSDFKLDEFDALDRSGKSGILIRPNGGEHTISYKGKHLDEESVRKFIQSVTGLHRNFIDEMTARDLAAKLDSLKQRGCSVFTGRQRFYNKTQKVTADLTAALQLPFNHFNQLESNELAKISASTLKWRDQEFYAGLDARVLNCIPSGTLIDLDARVLNNLSDKALKGLDARVLNNLSDKTLKSLDARVLNNLSDKALEGLDAGVIESLSDKTLRSLDARVLNNLSDKTLENSGNGIIDRLSDKTLKSLDARFFNSLGSYVLSNIYPIVFEKREEEFYKNLNIRVLNSLGQQTIYLIPEYVFKGRNPEFYNELSLRVLYKVPLSVIDDLAEVVRSSPNKSDAISAACAILKWDLQHGDERYIGALTYLKGLDARLLNSLSDKAIKDLHTPVIDNLPDEELKALDSRFFNNLSDDVLSNAPLCAFEKREEGFYKNLHVRVLNSLSKQALDLIPDYVFKRRNPAFYNGLNMSLLNRVPLSVIDDLAEVVRSFPNESDATSAAQAILKWDLPQDDERYVEAIVYLFLVQLESKINPYPIHKKLLKNQQSSILSFDQGQILTQAIAENSASTPATIGELKKTLQTTLPTLGQMQNLYEGLIQKEAVVKQSGILGEITLASCKSTCIEDPYIEGIYRLFGGPDENPIQRITFQFATVMRHILSLDNNAGKNELSLQEEVFLKFMKSLFYCRTGKADGITMFYQSLAREESSSGTNLSSQTKAPLLHKLVEQCLTESITENLVRAICRMKEKQPINQGVHQTQFLYNCLLPRVGLKVSLYFDRYAACILEPLVDLLDDEKKMEDAVRILGEHFTPLLLKNLNESFGKLILDYQKEMRSLEETKAEVERLKDEEPDIQSIREQFKIISARVTTSTNLPDKKAAMDELQQLRLKLDHAIASNPNLMAAIEKQKEHEANIDATLEKLHEYGWEAKEKILSIEEEIDHLLKNAGYLR